MSHVKSALKRKLINKDSDLKSEVFTPKKRERKLLPRDELDNRIKRFVSTIRKSGRVSIPY